MNQQFFQACVFQLLKDEDFMRLNFLRTLAQLSLFEEHKQLNLSLYAYYNLAHKKQHKAALQSIQQGLGLLQDTLPVVMLLTVKGALLSQIDRHNDSLHILREALAILHRLNNSQTVIKNIQRKMFIPFMSKIILLIDITRGRREFLMLFDEIRTQIKGNPKFGAIEEAVKIKINEIRDQNRCHGKGESQKKLTYSTSYNNLKNIQEGESNTSIYINRLYEERRKNLGQRDKSGLKKSLSNPYQLKVAETNSECYVM